MASEYFSQGKDAFGKEQYGESVELFTKAIEVEPTNEEYLLNRAQAQLKLGKNREGLEDARAALKSNPESSAALLLKGKVLMYMGQLDDSYETFLKGKKLHPSVTDFDMFIKKCKTGGESNPDAQKQAPAPPPEEEPASEPEPTKPEPTKPEPAKAAPKEKAEAAPETEIKAEVPMPAVPQTRYDWYQTDSYVTISIMLKKVKKEDADIDIRAESVSATVKLPAGDDYSLQLDLAHAIVADRAQVKVLSTKIDVKLPKVESVRWANLEREEGAAAKVKDISQATISPGVNPAKYPSSSQNPCDWDQVVSDIKKEEKDEKPEGEAALNQLFQQIYSDGNDEVRKAMNKSFSESGGTVLSTNWKEIAEKKTDVKPPDGMEYKNYSA